MCCRSISTNSIARIDKMEIISSGKIKNRWRENEYMRVKKNIEQLTKEFLKIFDLHSSQNMLR